MAEHEAEQAMLMLQHEGGGGRWEVRRTHEAHRPAKTVKVCEDNRVVDGGWQRRNRDEPRVATSSKTSKSDFEVYLSAVLRERHSDKQTSTSPNNKAIMAAETSFQFQCPSCSAVLQATLQKELTSVQCGECYDVFDVQHPGRCAPPLRSRSPDVLCTNPRPPTPLPISARIPPPSER